MQLNIFLPNEYKESHTSVGDYYFYPIHTIRKCYCLVTVDLSKCFHYKWWNDRSFIVKSKHLQWCRDNFLVHQINAKLFPIDLKNNWWQVFISLFILIVNAVYVNYVGRLTNRHSYSIEVACISILHNIRYYGVLGWNKA